MAQGHYTTEFKKELVKKYALAQKNGTFSSLVDFLKNNAPSVSKSSFYKWRDLYLDEVAAEAGLSQNEAKGVYGSEANTLPLAEKFKIILEISKLNEEEFGAYCRNKGLYASDIENWKQELSSFLTSNFLDERDAKQLKADIKDARQQLDQALKDNAAKDQEISRKDKALATYAAKVITMRNFQKLFADDTN